MLEERENPPALEAKEGQVHLAHLAGKPARLRQGPHFVHLHVAKPQSPDDEPPAHGGRGGREGGGHMLGYSGCPRAPAGGAGGSEGCGPRLTQRPQFGRGGQRAGAQEGPGIARSPPW